MTVAFKIILTLITFIAMEGVTWLTHKYVMHGFLWYLHRDHHQPRAALFEKNDAFFLIFAIPSILLMYFGATHGLDFRFSIGTGIMLYGFAYFFVHDIFIHQRFRFLRNANHWYARGLRKAHKVHHKHLDKYHGECFGMLFVPFRYFREAMQRSDNLLEK